MTLFKLPAQTPGTVNQGKIKPTQHPSRSFVWNGYVFLPASASTTEPTATAVEEVFEAPDRFISTCLGAVLLAGAFLLVLPPTPLPAWKWCMVHHFLAAQKGGRGEEFGERRGRRVWVGEEGEGGKVGNFASNY